MRHSVLVLKMRLTRYHSLDDRVLYTAPVLMSRKANILQRLEELSKRFLMTKTKVIQRLIEHILRTILIDGIISQMHVHIIDIILIHLLILLRRKSHQPLVIDIYP